MRLNEQEKANRRLRQRAYGLLAALVATIFLAGLAGWQWNLATVQTEVAQYQTEKAKRSAQAAKDQAKLAESRRLAASSDEVRPEHLDLAILLALEAVQKSDTFEARGSLQRAVNTSPEVVCLLRDLDGDVTSVAFTPEGGIATGCVGGRLAGAAPACCISGPWASGSERRL